MALLPGAGPVAGAGIAAGQALRPRTPQPDYQALLRGPEQGIFAKTLDIISRPLYATANVVNDVFGGDPGFSPIRSAWKGLVGEAKTTGSDILETLGVENRWVQTIGGLGLDILLDPITYISLGTGAGAMIATKTGTVSLSKVGQRTLRNAFAKHQARIGSELLEAAAKRAGTSADDLVRSGQHLNVLRPAEILEQAQKIARQEVGDLIDAGGRQLVDRGGFKLTLPFSEAGVIGRHLPATELTVAARGPIAAAANVTGAAWDRAVAAALAPVGRAVERIGQTGVATTLKRAFRHGTGFADVDALRQFAKGSENLYGKQFLDSLDEFSGNLRAAKLTRQQIDAVTLAAEEPGAIVDIARQLEVEFTEPMRQLADDFARFWKDSRAILLERGVNLPALGSGIDNTLLKYESIERKLTSKLARAKGRRAKKLDRELKKLSRRRAALQATAARVRGEAAELGAAAAQEGQEAAIRARGEVIEGRAVRLGGKEEIVRQRALEAQQRVKSGEEVVEILEAERAALPKTADVPVPAAKELVEPQRANVIARAAKAAEEARNLKVGDQVIHRFKPKGPGNWNFKTEAAEIAELPSKANKGLVKLRWKDPNFVVGFAEEYVPLSEVVQRGGATGRKAQAAAFRQLPKDTQRAARATRRGVENWAQTRALAGDQGAQEAAEMFLEADNLVTAGKNKEAGILRSQARDSALRHAGETFDVDWTTPVGEAELWAKIRPELEAAGIDVPTIRAPSPERAKAAAELRKVRRGIRRVKRQGGKEAGKLATLERQQASLEKRLGELGPISRTATAGKARALKQKGFAKTAQERVIVRRARRLTTAIEQTKGDIRDLATMTDADLEKVRGEIARFRAAKLRVPDFVPHTLSPEARAFLKEVDPEGGRFGARLWSDKDPHALARTLVDRDMVPLTLRQIDDAIRTPEGLAKLRPSLDAKIARKLERIGQEFPEWFKARQEKGLGASIRRTLGKNQLFARFTKRAPVEDVAKWFEVNPERIFTSRITEMTKAIKGADFYSGLVDPSIVGRQAVRKLDIPGKRFLKGEKLDEALDIAVQVSAGEKLPKGWKGFDDITRKIEQLASAAGEPLPKGWQTFDNIKALKGHAFHPEVADEIARTAGSLTSEKATNTMLRGYDKTLTLWKRWVLVAPAYVTRNMFGNFANNFYAGVNLGSYTKALRAQRGKDIIIAGKKWTAKQIEDLARQWDVWKGGLYGSVFAEHMNALTGRKTSKLRTAINALPDWTFKGNNYVETNARVAHFISKLEDGLSPAEAARSVTKYLFDYGEATKFEDQVMRRMVFFYSWLRNNTALQVGQLFHEPWKVLAPVRAAQEITKTGKAPEDLRAIQPEWTTRMLNAFIGRDDNSGDIKILTQFGLPMEDVLRLDWQELVGQVTPMLRIPVELTTGRRLGFGRGEAIVEYDRAYSFLKHMPDSIKDWIEFEEITWPNGRKSFRMNPWKLYALTNNPFSRLYTQLGKVFDQRRGVGEKLLATMTGVKVARFNEQGARLRAAREQLGAALREAEQRGRVGKFTRFFGRKGRQVSEKEAGLLEQQAILGKARKKFYTERDQKK